MENLARVIGPAPSEVSLEELEKKVKEEHSRIAGGLVKGLFLRKRKAPQSINVSKITVAKRLEKKYGMSLEEMQRKLELLKELEKKEERK